MEGPYEVEEVGYDYDSNFTGRYVLIKSRVVRYIGRQAMTQVVGWGYTEHSRVWAMPVPQEEEVWFKRGRAEGQGSRIGRMGYPTSYSLISAQRVLAYLSCSRSRGERFERSFTDGLSTALSVYRPRATRLRSSDWPTGPAAKVSL